MMLVMKSTRANKKEKKCKLSMLKRTSMTQKRMLEKKVRTNLMNQSRASRPMVTMTALHP